MPRRVVERVSTAPLSASRYRAPAGLDVDDDNTLFSATAQAAPFHTDSSDATVFPDIAGLLCVDAGSSAEDEGVLAFANGANVWRAIERDAAPAVRNRLREPFAFDFIGRGFNDTQALSLEARERNSFPVFSDGPRGLTVRYNKLWLERGAARRDEAREARGLARVDDPRLAGAVSAMEAALAATPRLEAKMAPGDMVFTNNHRVLHARTAFNDVADARRHKSRVWIKY